jgi:hypothetical protein
MLDGPLNVAPFQANTATAASPKVFRSLLQSIVSEPVSALPQSTSLVRAGTAPAVE